MNILKELYESKSGKDRTAFRIEVSNLCGWATPKTFYDKMKDDTKLSYLELEAIKKLR